MSFHTRVTITCNRVAIQPFCHSPLLYTLRAESDRLARGCALLRAARHKPRQLFAAAALPSLAAGGYRITRERPPVACRSTLRAADRTETVAQLFRWRKWWPHNFPIEFATSSPPPTSHPRDVTLHQRLVSHLHSDCMKWNDDQWLTLVTKF